MNISPSLLQGSTSHFRFSGIRPASVTFGAAEAAPASSRDRLNRLWRDPVMMGWTDVYIPLVNPTNAQQELLNQTGSLLREAEAQFGDKNYAGAKTKVETALANLETLTPSLPPVKREGAFGHVRELMAHLYFINGQDAPAEAILSKLVKFPKVHYMDKHRWINNLALVYKQQGRLAEAEELLKSGIAYGEKIWGGFTPNPNDKDRLGEVNRANEYAGWYQGAMMMNLADLYLQRKEVAQAEQTFQKLADNMPDLPLLMGNHYSYMHGRMERLAEVVTLLTEAGYPEKAAVYKKPIIQAHADLLERKGPKEYYTKVLKDILDALA